MAADMRIAWGRFLSLMHAALVAVAVLPIANCDGQDFSDIPIIDTHIHLYDTGREQGLPWPPKSDKVLFRPVLTADFDKIAKENGIAATVIVEASSWSADNEWVLDLVQHDPKKYVGLVGSLKIGTDEFTSRLKQLCKDERFVGIRARERETDDYFTDEVWRDLKLLADMDKSLDVLMFNFSLDEVAQIAKRLPNLRILMNHLAGANADGKRADPEWVKGIERVAKYSNVHCKISGLFQQSHLTPSPTDVAFYKPTLDVLYEAFGEDRLIYGSNWPVTMRGGKYGDFKQVVMDYFKPKGRECLEKLLYRNAMKFYDLEHVDLK